MYFAWKPSELPRVLIVTPAVYPRLVANYDFNYFSLKLLNLESQNQAQNVPAVLPNFPIKSLGIHELWSDIVTNKQRLLLCIYMDAESATTQCDSVCILYTWYIRSGHALYIVYKGVYRRRKGAVPPPRLVKKGGRSSPPPITQSSHTFQIWNWRVENIIKLVCSFLLLVLFEGEIK